ncbi:MAG: hypothetical protein WC958_02990 [Dehalococcoidales bacterium]
MKNTEKQDTITWLTAVVPLYRQAEEITVPFTNIGPDGFPTDLDGLANVLVALPPILATVKKLPKPEYSKLRLLQKDFKLTLDACIKSAKNRLKFEQKRGRFAFSAAVFWTDLAISFKTSFSKKMDKMILDYDKGGIL